MVKGEVEEGIRIQVFPLSNEYSAAVIALPLSATVYANVNWLASGVIWEIVGALGDVNGIPVTVALQSPPPITFTARTLM